MRVDHSLPTVVAVNLPQILFWALSFFLRGHRRFSMKRDSVLTFWSTRSAVQFGDLHIQQSANYRTWTIRQCLRCSKPWSKANCQASLSTSFIMVWRYLQQRNEKHGCLEDDIDGRDRLMIGRTRIAHVPQLQDLYSRKQNCFGKCKSMKVTAIQRHYGVPCPPYNVLFRKSLEELMQIMSLHAENFSSAIKANVDTVQSSTA